MTKPKKSKITVKKSTKKRKPVTKITVHDPDPVLEVVVHDEIVRRDPTFLERAQAWLKENFS